MKGRRWIAMAALSVMLNICEGFLRRRDKETLQFLRYAFASNGELKATYYAAEGRNYLTGVERSDLITLNESIAKMLRRWQSTLQVPREPATDHLTDADPRRARRRRDG